MRQLKSLFIGVASFLIVVLGVGYFLPSEAKVERVLVIEALPEEVFPYIDNMQAFNQWSPWYRKDPKMNIGYEGPDVGVGNKMVWVSSKKNGDTGWQEIVELEENKYVRTKLNFGEDRDAVGHFHLKLVDEERTQVTWGFAIDFGYNIVGRYFGHTFTSSIAAEYEKGLKNLKQLVESELRQQEQEAQVREAQMLREAEKAQQQEGRSMEFREEDYQMLQ